MLKQYKISKITGPSGIFAGYILFIFGVVSLYFTLTSIPIIILGAVLAFSYSKSIIDFGSKRYKQMLYLFGFIPLGSWVDLEPEDKILIKHLRGGFVTHSLSNRSTGTPVNDFRVILQRESDHKKITIARFKTEEEANELGSQLKILQTGD